jgi:hypothetical protein
MDSELFSKMTSLGESVLQGEGNMADALKARLG